MGTPEQTTEHATSDLATMGLSSWNLRGVLTEHPELHRSCATTLFKHTEDQQRAAALIEEWKSR